MNPTSNLTSATTFSSTQQRSPNDNSPQEASGIFAERKVSIAGLTKGSVLKHLFDNANGMGRELEITDHASTMLQLRETMDIDEAKCIIIDYNFSGRKLYFDYINGRPIKTDISGDSIDTESYDNYNGLGSASDAIAQARESKAMFRKAIAQARQSSGVATNQPNREELTDDLQNKTKIVD